MRHADCTKNKENVIIVIKDAMRKDRFSCYGGNVNTSNIDLIGSIGTKLNSCIAVTPSTAMSIAGIIFGKYPYDFGMTTYHTRAQLTDSSFISVFKEFSKKGYSSHIFMSKFYMDFMPHPLEFVRIHFCKSSYKSYLEKIRSSLISLKKEGKRFFFWIHCGRGMEHAINRKYTLELDWQAQEFDYFIGQLLELIDIENTRIFITSDHGQLLGEIDGQLDYGFHLHEAAINVPLVISDKHYEYLEDVPISNKDIKAMLLGKHIDVSKYIISDTAYFWQPQRKIMVRKGNFKYIWCKESEKEMLYDLENDPHENINLLMKKYVDKYRIHGIYDPHGKFLNISLQSRYRRYDWNKIHKIEAELRRVKDYIQAYGQSKIRMNLRKSSEFVFYRIFVKMANNLPLRRNPRKHFFSIYRYIENMQSRARAS